MKGRPPARGSWSGWWEGKKGEEGRIIRVTAQVNLALVLGNPPDGLGELGRGAYRPPNGHAGRSDVWSSPGCTRNPSPTPVRVHTPARSLVLVLVLVLVLPSHSVYQTLCVWLAEVRLRMTDRLTTS